MKNVDPCGTLITQTLITHLKLKIFKILLKKAYSSYIFLGQSWGLHYFGFRFFFLNCRYTILGSFLEFLSVKKVHKGQQFKNAKMIKFPKGGAKEHIRQLGSAK